MSRNEAFYNRVYGTMIGLMVGLGVAVLSGGPGRFSGPSFQGPKDLISWLPFWPEYIYWGLLFLLHGISLVVAQGKTWEHHVLRFGTVVCFFWVTGFIKAAFDTPVAALTGIVAYSAFGLIFAFLSMETDG